MTCQKEYENLNCNHVCRLYPRHQLHRKPPKYQGFGDIFCVGVFNQPLRFECVFQIIKHSIHKNLIVKENKKVDKKLHV